jgi:hypothetical protein
MAGADAQGLTMLRAVMAHYGWSETRAKSVMQRARDDAPKAPPAPPVEREPVTPLPGQACHICDDCGYATERKGLLSIHVHSHHHRSLTAAESRFQIYEGADA